MDQTNISHAIHANAMQVYNELHATYWHLRLAKAQRNAPSDIFVDKHLIRASFHISVFQSISATSK